jgi:hypothetical protein
MSYIDMPEGMVANMIAAEPSLKVIQQFDNRRDIRLMMKNALGESSKSYANDFGGLWSIKWTTFEPKALPDLESKMQLSPVAGLDELTRKLLIEMKVGADPDVYKVSPNDIFNILLRDRYARTDVTSEQLFAILMSDKAIMNPVVMANILVYMGYSPDLVSQVVLRLTGGGTDPIALRKALKVASTAGGFNGWIDQGKTNYDRMIDMTGCQVMQPVMQGILYEVAYSLVVSESFKAGKLVGIKLTAGDNTLSSLNKTVSGPLRKEWMVLAMQPGYSKF